ncbi:MAG: prepilin-type N-terminal cleavage/methylation domain-containing protein [Candidatus Omnitrophica bacterium]|nr:prepilin-type N-terminal cleavage/methylation domain-containing protein [Candidatus Omnitrophota bacterium]
MKIEVKSHYAHQKALSLVEVLVAAAVLSLGVILVSQGMLVALEGFNYAVDYLNVLLWMDWKFWDLHDKLMNYRTLGVEDNQGAFSLNNRNFNWDLNFNLIEGTKEASLYEMTLNVYWKEGMRPAKATRTADVLYVMITDK